MDLIAGIDEAGRGSFLGRVYSGCVIWDNNIWTQNNGVEDI